MTKSVSAFFALTAALFALAVPSTSALASSCPSGLTGVLSGGKVTYTFHGRLTAPFGTLPVGAAFNGHVIYVYPQVSSPLNTPGVKGHYKSFKIKIDFSGQAAMDSGAGTIDVYDKPSFYPTDMFHAYNTTPVSGTLGGLNLASGAGLQVVFHNLAGTAWTTTALPDQTRTMANFTVGNGTFIQLQSTSGVTARGQLCPF